MFAIKCKPLRSGQVEIFYIHSIEVALIDNPGDNALLCAFEELTNIGDHCDHKVSDFRVWAIDSSIDLVPFLHFDEIFKMFAFKIQECGLLVGKVSDFMFGLNELWSKNTRSNFVKLKVRILNKKNLRVKYQIEKGETLRLMRIEVEWSTKKLLCSLWQLDDYQHELLENSTSVVTAKYLFGRSW